MPAPRRALLVARSLPAGRETLAARARAGDDTTGWEPVTLRALAAPLALAALADDGRVEGDDVALVEATGAALDGALADGALDAVTWRSHAARLGFRTALHDAVQSLRVAGVAPSMLGDVPGEVAALLAVVLARYEDELARRALADPAHLVATALAAFDDEAPWVLGDARVVLAAGLRPTGLLARLAERLLAHGAEREAGDDGGAAPLALDPAARDWTIRRAATPDDEFRAVLRAHIASGRPLDELEVAVADVDTWGAAIHATCVRLGAPCTLAAGLPLARTRLGRALARWSAFVRASCDARALWTALLEGDIAAPPSHDVAPERLAHDLRALGVGWGRERWDAARARIADGRWAAATARDARDAEREVDDADLAARAAAMVALLDAVLVPLPPLPARGALADTVTTASALATAALAWLALAERPGDRDEAPIVARIRARLARVVEGDTIARPTALALAVVEQALADVRWWPAWPLVPAVRTSAPGALHVVELRDAGITGRPVVALLGLDTERTGGGTAPQPFLSEGLRARVDAAMRVEALPLADARVREARARLDWALVRCVGREVTLSWTAFEPGRDAELTPDARVVEAARVAFGAPELGARELRERLGEPHGPVPLARAGAPLVPLDAREAWLHAMHGDPRGWRDARAALRTVRPHLARAAAQRAAYAEGAATDAFALETLGHVPDFATAGNPFAGRRVSASELEALGTCASKWFYRYLLRARPPLDAEFEPFAWLDAGRQGDVLHAVFERVGREVIAGTLDLRDGDVATARALALLDARLAEVALELPPPSDWIRDAEREALAETLRRWVAVEGEALADGARWLEVEADLAGTVVRLGDFDVEVAGRIDRVDRLADGTLRVVDYKTTRRGAPKYFGKGGRHLRGGRLVQPLLYALALATARGTAVSGFEYRFPFAAPPHGTRRVDRAMLDAGEAVLLPSLVAQLRDGAFLPTDDAEDCRACDVGEVCRSRVVGHETDAPRAAWSKERLDGVGLLVPLRRRRAGEAPAQ